MRPDLSQIHPLKRVTLIVLGFLFGTSIAFAICMQLFYFEGHFVVTDRLLAIGGGQLGLWFSVQPLDAGPYYTNWTIGFRCSEYSADEFSWERGESHPESWLVPGLYLRTFHNGFANLRFVLEKNKGFALTVHHAWLISITAALCLFTRWRIRRSAIRQSFMSSDHSPQA